MGLSRRTLLLASSGSVGLVCLGAIGLWAKNGLAGHAVPIARDESFPKLPIGMNLAGIADWEPGFPFKNLFWGARPWLTRNLSGKGPHDTNAQAAFEYDEDGYPLEVPVVAPGLSELQTVFTYVPNVRSPGRYVLLYEGEGEIDGLASTKVIRRGAGRVVLQMSHGTTGGGEAVLIKRSERGNHIRNIRLVAEIEEGDNLEQDPFLPEFLDFCRPFHCLRFMDWGNTNNSLQEQWSDRKRPSFYTMVARTGDPAGTWGAPPSPFDYKFAGGVAYEYMIQLCNTLQTDMWLCIPHRATDDYIWQLAKLVRNKLDPRLKVYLEYSNEIWNWQFHQAGWMLRSPLAGALVEAKGGFPWKDSEKREGKDHPERIGALFRRAFAIWEQEWAEDRKRLIRVCAVQAAWADASIRTIRWCLENGGVDAVSPAAYVGPDKTIYQKWAGLGEQLTPDDVIDEMEAVVRRLRSEGGLLEIIAFAQKHGLTYLAYEGGQHIQPEGQKDMPYSPALAGAQAHPRMYDLYVELLRLHRDLGCRMFGHFSSIGKQGTRWGSWGAKSSYDEPDNNSPKMRALIACNAQK
jgi:hypothetical protein